MKSYISNNCANISFYFREKREYDHPIIGALFVNDDDYVKFCSNIDSYMSYEPIFLPPRLNSLWTRQNGSEWYLHTEIKPPYPVMYLGDVEIHWIHENNEKELLEKFKRRRERFFINRAKKNTEYYFLFSSADRMNNISKQDDTLLLRKYLSNPNAIYMTRYPEDLLTFENEKKEGRIELIDRWISQPETRSYYHVPIIHEVGDRTLDYQRILKGLNEKET